MSVTIGSETALLLELMRGKGHGLALAQRVKERTCGVVVLNPGNLYPTLRKLERMNLAASKAGSAPERGGRETVVYEITAAGAKEGTRRVDALRRLTNSIRTT